MSERTVVGGVAYESVGSSKSNLLLKCNGTARIQWGGKLIDLIKDGKIASGNNQEFIYVIDNQENINKDGVYIIQTNTEEESDTNKTEQSEQRVPQIIIYKDNQQYNLIGTDIYISASKKQNITADQRKQAIENIGLCYNTLEDLQKSEIQNGLAYVYDTKKLYTIKDGALEEFQSEVKNVTVEQSNEVTSGNSDSNSSSEVVPEQAASALYSRSTSSNGFFKGMIVMFSGTQEVPEGWALCDGQEHTYEEITTKTPDLRDLNSNSLIYIMKL